MSTLFVSDLHLHESRPAVTQCFIDFLAEAANRTDALYILGDLFEVWIGDDDPAPDHRAVAQALKRFTDAGPACYLTHGNRDFLIGAQYARESGLQLLDEITTIDLHGEKVLLMHGDELCTDDVSYQRFRRIVRNPIAHAIFRMIPLDRRRSIGERLRRSSQESDKPESITDVNQRAVETAMREADVKTLVHGHTHRPGIHRFKLNDANATRVVLGDWYTQGSVLHWNADGPDLRTLPIDTTAA